MREKFREIFFAYVEAAGRAVIESDKDALDEAIHKAEGVLELAEALGVITPEALCHHMEALDAIASTYETPRNVTRKG